MYDREGGGGGCSKCIFHRVISDLVRTGESLNDRNRIHRHLSLGLFMIKMDRRAFLSTGVSAVIAGCTSSEVDGEEPERTDSIDEMFEETPEQNDSNIAWETDIPEPNAGPLGYNDQIYLPIQNYLIAFDELTGHGLWEGEVFRGANGAPFLTEDRAYVPSRQGGVYGFNHSGTLDWRVERDHFSPRTPVVTDEMVFSGRSDIAVMSIDDEEVIAEVTRGGSFDFTADSNTIYFVLRERDGISHSHVFRAVDFTTGEVLWSVDYSYSDFSQPQIVGDEILVKHDSNLISLDKSTGEEVWRQSFANSFGYSVIGEPGSDDTRLYVRERDSGRRRDTIYAFHYPIREQKWSYSRDYELLEGPVVTDGSLFVTGSDNEITQLDPTDGSVSGRVQLDRPIGQPTVTNEMVVVLSSRNEILGIRREVF